VNEVVQVDIFGSQYTIRKGTEDPEYIARVAAYVDNKMREINERLPVASVSREGGSLGRDKNGLDRLEKCCAELDRALAGLE
jgi:hypothetical protein